MQRLVQLDEPTGNAVLAAARDVMSVLHGVRHLVSAPRGTLTPDDARTVAQRLLIAAGA